MVWTALSHQPQNNTNPQPTKRLTKTMDIKGPINRSKFQGFDIHSFFMILLVGDLCCFVAGDLALSTPLLDERVPGTFEYIFAALRRVYID